MVKIKLNYLFVIFFIFFSSNLFFANPNTDLWMESDKSYKDLIDEGFEVKSYDITTIEIQDGIKIILFVTVLQKEKEVFECQEYQTLDESMQTLDLTLICRELTQPFQKGVGT